jgi:hypothetical protein
VLPLPEGEPALRTVGPRASLHAVAKKKKKKKKALAKIEAVLVSLQPVALLTKIFRLCSLPTLILKLF